MATVGVKGLN